MSFVPTFHTSRSLMAVVFRDLKPSRVATNLAFTWPWYMLLSKKAAEPHKGENSLLCLPVFS